ncbi:MAG: hypothetical protein K1Y36_09350 [Blastocatellia bacterium]|nr:hypothetical protein [Blastocatellia bacterium]
MKYFSFFLLVCLSVSGFVWLPSKKVVTVRAESPESSTFQWTLNGPFGGTVRSLVQNPKQPERFFLGTGDGQLYLSNDKAQSWKWLPTLHRPGFIIDNLLIDPRASETVYLSMWSLANDRDGGIFKSTDGGEHWKELFQGHSVRALTMADQDSSLLVAGALDGVYRSTDAGKSWKLISPANDAEIRNIESVAIDPRDGDTVFAGTWHLPWKTTDGGKNWVSIKGAETMILDDSDIFSIAIDRSLPDRMFCSACSGIYQSNDRGRNWTKFQGIPYSARRTHIIYQHPTKPATLFACTTEGLWRTTDGGQTWRVLTKQIVVNAIEIDEHEPDRVVIGTQNSGVLVSQDGGETFLPSNLGFATYQVSSLVPDPLQRGRVFASVLYNGLEGGVYVSEDNGRSWRPSSQGLGIRDVYSVTVNPNNPKQLYAATNTGLFLSENSGLTWNRLEITAKAAPPSAKPTGKGKGKPRSRSVVARPKSRPKTPAPPPGPKLHNLDGHVMEVALTTDGKKAVLLAASWDGLFRSSDPKRGWEKLTITGYEGRVFAVVVPPLQPNWMYVGTSDGLFVSRDKGVTWEHIEMDGRDHSFVHEIAVNPNRPEIIAVGTRRSLYITKDGMKTWERRGRGIPYGDIAAIRFNPRDDKQILVGEVGEGGLYLSTDGGDHFRRIDREDLPSKRVWTVAFDLFEENQVYAGSFSSGVLVGAPSRPHVTAGN